MKTLTNTINEKLSISRHTVKKPTTVKDMLEFALPELEKEMKNILGPDVRNFDFDLHVNESTNRRNETIYEIESGELIDLTGPLGKIYYEKYRFSTWGGNHVEGDNGEKKIWFNPKFHFSYINGGSNGNDAFWHGLWFNLDTQEWEFGRKLTDKY